ncbi:MAG: patatin-like phospholipase family protein [Sulfurovum sp.]|nr:patatin-like phospholipase family protein [Sulfurovum sp.]
MGIVELGDENFSLVLSGGGALGISHLGVLYDMEQKDLSPSEIIGTSMGGIIGACLAIGMHEKQIHERLKSFAAVSKWIKFTLGGNSIVDSARIERIFDSIFGDRMMSDVKIPLKIIVANLTTGDKRVFGAGDKVMIKDVILATMAIPGIFKEKIIEGKIYGDGFLCENLGLNECSYHNILAVDAIGYNSFAKEMPDSIFKTFNIVEMLERSIRLLMYNQTKQILDGVDKNILLLEPNTSNYKTFHFHKVDKIRELGIGLI